MIPPPLETQKHTSRVYPYRKADATKLLLARAGAVVCLHAAVLHDERTAFA